MAAVDHSLAMFRSGAGAGHRGGEAHQIGGSGGYLPGMGNQNDMCVKPVSDDELEKAHDRIRCHLTTRWSTFRKAFRSLDFDFSGKIDSSEAMRILMHLGLTDIREATLLKLMSIADANGDGLVSYDEFCTLMMAEDALPLAQERAQHDHHLAGPWAPQGGAPLVAEATLARAHIPVSPSLPDLLLNAYKTSKSNLLEPTSLVAEREAKIFQPGKPFDRKMWLERNRLRRQEDSLTKNQHILRRITPPAQLKNMTFEEGIMAITMYKSGGDPWSDWSRSHPYVGMSTPQPNSSAWMLRTGSAGGLRPLGSSASVGRLRPSKRKDVVWSERYKTYLPPN